MIIAITGGIATGKSHVVKVWRKLGAYCIEADKIARDILRPGRKVYRAVLGAFGKEALSPRGRLNRKALAKIIFAHPKKRRLLERLTHPVIIQEMRARAKGRQLAVWDAPLLFEARLSREVDVIVVVASPRARQIERLSRREGLHPPEIHQRLLAQWPLSKNISRADFVIQNNGSLKELARKAGHLWRILKKRVDKTKRGVIK